MKELSETIALMTSEDYKERMKAEYWQTKIRHMKLSELIKKYEAGTLEFEPKCGQLILMAQRDYMQSYLILLEKRASIEGIDLNGETAHLELQVEELQRCLCACMKLLTSYICTNTSSQRFQTLAEDLNELTEKYPQILKG